MNTLLIVANMIAINTAEAPLVLDGCNTASADRAAQIADMPAGGAETMDAVADLLAEPDGAVCLMESWTLVRVYHAQGANQLIAQALADGLSSDEPHIAARAARLTRVLGVGDASAFAAVLLRAERTDAVYQVMANELDSMPPSASKSALVHGFDVAATPAPEIWSSQHP